MQKNIYDSRSYNSVPPIFENKEIPTKQIFTTLVAEDCFETYSESKIITFDSGEDSDRRLYVESTLLYMTQIKGIPCVAISAADNKITEYYLAKVPYPIRNKVLDLGIFHTYQRLAEQLKEIVSFLYLDLRNKNILDYFFFGLRALESKLIAALNRLNITVILDRTMLSAYIYSLCLKEGNSLGPPSIGLSELNLALLKNFKPISSFFVHSKLASPKDRKKDIKKLHAYDSYEFLNYSIRGLIPQIKQELPHLIELPETNNFETNMEIIKEALVSFQ